MVGGSHRYIRTSQADAFEAPPSKCSMVFPVDNLLARGG